MVFFGISFGILLVALISYDLAFVYLNGYGSDRDKFILFLAMLPLTPIMPFILYFTPDRYAFLSKLFESNCCIPVDFDEIEISPNRSALRRYVQFKTIDAKTTHLHTNIESDSLKRRRENMLDLS